MTLTKKLWVGIGMLILFTPLGLFVPKWFGAEGAWGEWGLEEIGKVAGYVPEGMKRLTEIWKAPMPEYALPGQNKGLALQGLGYMVSAILGIALAAGVMYIIAKLLGRKNGAG
jgi:cobalt/nickel transport protein